MTLFILFCIFRFGLREDYGLTIITLVVFLVVPLVFSVYILNLSLAASILSSGPPETFNFPDSSSEFRSIQYNFFVVLWYLHYIVIFLLLFADKLKIFFSRQFIPTRWTTHSAKVPKIIGTIFFLLLSASKFSLLLMNAIQTSHLIYRFNAHCSLVPVLF